MKELAEAGLDSLNISLVTLDREGSLKITRRDLLDDTLAGIKEAMKYERAVKDQLCAFGNRGAESV